MPCSVHGQLTGLLTGGSLPAEISVPGGDILVCEPGGDVKHDDCTLTVDVVPIPQATKLLLPSSVPAVEPQLATIGSEVQRMHLHSNGGCRK